MSAMSIAQQLAAAELWLAGHWWLLFLAALALGVFLGSVIIFSVKFFRFLDRFFYHISNGR